MLKATNLLALASVLLATTACADSLPYETEVNDIGPAFKITFNSSLGPWSAMSYDAGCYDNYWWEVPGVTFHFQNTTGGDKIVSDYTGSTEEELTGKLSGIDGAQGGWMVLQGDTDETQNPFPAFISLTLTYPGSTTSAFALYPIATAGDTFSTPASDTPASATPASATPATATPASTPGYGYTAAPSALPGSMGSGSGSGISGFSPYTSANAGASFRSAGSGATVSSTANLSKVTSPAGSDTTESKTNFIDYTNTPESSSDASSAVVIVATEVPSTTIVTMTSCSDNGCYRTTATTGVAIYTTMSDGIEVVYTTYCPLTASKETSYTNVSTSAVSISSEDISDSTSTVYVSITVIESATAPTGLVQSLVSSSSTASSPASVSTYAGLAPSTVPLAGTALGFLTLFLALFV